MRTLPMFMPLVCLARDYVWSPYRDYLQIFLRLRLARLDLFLFPFAAQC
jgi:hypothetical protein